MLGAGIGLRDPHFREIERLRPAIGWLEVHSENFFGNDPRRKKLLETLRSDYPLSLHGVGLSLGTAGPLDQRHLAELCELAARCDPWMVSEHCSWGGVAGRHSNNLLPLPRTHEGLDVVCTNIRQVQDALGRRIALENVATYLEFEDADCSEPQFLNEIVQRTGCGLLLDISNLHVNSVNHGFDAFEYLGALRGDAVVEFHLAGHEDRGHTLIDAHGSPVAEAGWTLFGEALRRIGPRPVLIEWDVDLPRLDVLLGEMHRADRMLGARP